MNPSPHHHPAKANAEDDTRQRWRTVFVDGGVLEATLSRESTAPAPHVPETRVIGRLDDRVNGVRKNVQDAAAAVLAWLSAVIAHEGKTDLDAVLDSCLRPGPDIERVNYAAMAQEIQRVTGIELTAKRVQTAVTHLRKAHTQAKADQPTPAAQPRLREALQLLDQHLRDNFQALTAHESAERLGVRRQIGVEVLTAVRAAAGRVIDRDFGEGIPDLVDLHQLEGRFLGFVRDTLNLQAGRTAPARGRLEQDLRRLLITLADHDGTAELDMKLVMHGAQVVGSLLGPDSLPGVMAQLNVLVAGRSLIDTDLYVAEMLRLADRAESLHDDPATRSLMNWVRRLPEDQRLPSPIRVSSYCRSNASTRLFDRLYTGDLNPDDPALADATHPPRTYLQLACDTHDAMLQRDAGFTLTLTTELIRHTVLTHLTQDATAFDAYLQTLGQDRALDRLEALIRFENNDELVAAARDRILRAYPALKRQIITAR